MAENANPFFIPFRLIYSYISKFLINLDNILITRIETILVTPFPTALPGSITKNALPINCDNQKVVKPKDMHIYTSKWDVRILIKESFLLGFRATTKPGIRPVKAMLKVMPG